MKQAMKGLLNATNLLDQGLTGAQLYSGRSVNTTFTVPAGVTSISACAIGVGGSGGGTNIINTSGGGGGGGALAYTNNIKVYPGEQLKVYINGDRSYLARRGNEEILVSADAGVEGRSPTTYGVSGANGRGGLASNSIGDIKYSGAGGGSGAYARAGGGAAGYSANGNTGLGGSGANGNGTYNGAGGTGILGEGASAAVDSGQGGSGGSNGGTYVAATIFVVGRGGLGGDYGGGSGGAAGSAYTSSYSTGGDGAIRIVWGTTYPTPSV